MNSVLRPSIFSPHPEVLSALSTRRGGVSPEPYGMNLSFRVGDDAENVRRNRELFFGGLGVRPEELAIPGQVHSANILCVTAPGGFPECDGLITDVPRLFVCVSVADCVPILLFEPEARVVAAVHAGWRGTVARIVAGAVGRMVDQYGARADSLKVFIGPSAGACCYAVGPEVAEQFDNRFVSRQGDGIVVDLKTANFRQLLDAGIPPEHIEISPLCTISEPALLHSYRRDREYSGRMMGVIGLR